MNSPRFHFKQHFTSIRRRAFRALAQASALVLLFPLQAFSEAGQLDPTFGQNGIVKINAQIGPRDSFGIGSVETPTGGYITFGQVGSGSQEVFAMAKFLANGTIDPSFGQEGYALTPTKVDEFKVNAVIQDSSGKIVVAGRANDAFAVARYLKTGELDSTFGEGGVVTTVTTTGQESAFSIIEDTEGRLVVAGGSPAGITSTFTIIRYLQNGSLDTSFGQNGIVNTSIGQTKDIAYSVIEDSDGQLVVAGSSHDGEDPTWNEPFACALARYKSDGELDTSFGGGDGYVVCDADKADEAKVVIEDSQGNLVIAGRALDDLALMRYTNTGSIDTSFGGGDGFVFSQETQTASSLVEDSLGNYVTQNGSAISRFTTDGYIDNSFGPSGTGTVNVSEDADYRGSALIKDSSENFVITGTLAEPVHMFGTTFSFGIARLDTNGSIDSSFGSNGLASTMVPGASSDRLYSISLTQDGSIVAAGRTYLSNSKAALLKLTSSGSLDASFSGNGLFIESWSTDGSESSPNSSIIDSKGKILVAGDGGSPDEITVAKYTEVGEADSSFGGGDGIVTTSVGFSDEAEAIIETANGDYLVGGSSRGSSRRDFVIVRYDNNGNLDSNFGGGDGIVTTAMDSVGISRINAIIEKRDSRIIAVGHTDPNGGRMEAWALACFTSDGELDTSFGNGNGKIVTPIGSGEAFAMSAVEDSQGNIVVAGYSRADDNSYLITLARYLPSGELDPQFGNSGILTTPIGASGQGIAFSIIQDSKNRYVISGLGVDDGDRYSNLMLARYTSDGVLDPTFANDGIAIIGEDIGLQRFRANDIIEDQEGRYLVAGYDSVNDFIIARINAEDAGTTASTSSGGGGAGGSGGTLSPLVLFYLLVAIFFRPPNTRKIKSIIENK